MTVYSDDERRHRRSLCDGIQDRVDALTRPIVTREEQRVWDGGRGRMLTRIVSLSHPSLLEQLQEPAHTGTAGRSAPGHRSRAPANLAAVDALVLIQREAAAWVRYLTARPPSTDTPANLHTLASRAHDLDTDDLDALASEVLRWWASARVVSGWETPAWRPNVRCMACNALGGIRVRPDPISAVCLKCGAAWDEQTVGLLASHIAGEAP